MSSVVRIVN